MTPKALHSFHIPVLGLAYSIDTPVKVARFGIASAISIMDDQLLEDMRQHYCTERNEPYQAISEKEEDHRARRITAYLNLMNTIVGEQVALLRGLPFEAGNEIMKYFELLPEQAPAKHCFKAMLALKDGQEKHILQNILRNVIAPGAIDVNIMVKVDRTNFDAEGRELPRIHADAHAALRGFAESELTSSVIFSAGYNPALYAYAEQFPDFFPDAHGRLQKKIILKVSDYRSALVQGKILAKKGLWVSEFRIESGLNCGGHAFATEGLLMGPILEAFRNDRDALHTELFELCAAAIAAKQAYPFLQQPSLKITAQGGIGTANEDAFLLDYYKLDGTGWGSPFLLVPEATNVDQQTLEDLATAKQEDYFLSDASPLGIPFHNFRKSSAERQRQKRIAKGRPGSPCHKAFLAANTEFGGIPICTASRKYQYLKIKQLQEQGLSEDQFKLACQSITDKDCLCEGLGVPVRLTNNMPLSHGLSAVTICPGPNLAYFSGVFTLRNMVDHIYGRTDIRNTLYRPNLFINELRLYIDHLLKKSNTHATLTPKQAKSLSQFKVNMLEGIAYYKKLVIHMKQETLAYVTTMKQELDQAAAIIMNLDITAKP